MSTKTPVMTFNHLSFPSTDLPATAAFFEKYLDFTIAARMETFYILKRPGFDVVIEQADYAHAWPKNFHVGFELPNVDALRSLYDRFNGDDVTMETAVFFHERGSRFFCRAPGGLMFELNTRADADERYRGTFN